jgi:hypothetical protein
MEISDHLHAQATLFPAQKPQQQLDKSMVWPEGSEHGDEETNFCSYWESNHRILTCS